MTSHEKADKLMDIRTKVENADKIDRDAIF